MDQERFDRITEALARRLPRRSLTGVLAALPALAHVVGEARPKKKPKSCQGTCKTCERCRRGRCRRKPSGVSCPGGACAGGACRCGAGPACGAGQMCIDGRCAAACDDACAVTCNACASAFDLTASFCAAPSGGCSGVTSPCTGHADCGPNQLCTFTTCPPINGTSNRCQTLCGQ